MLISDDPISLQSRSSSETLVRLFQNYPANRLTIIQTQGAGPAEDLRIPAQAYYFWRVPWDRVLHTRLNVPANIMKAAHHRWTYRRYADSAKTFAPDAVITLVHNNGWVLACRVAEQLDIPLHLIIHDGPDHFRLSCPISGRFMRKEFMRACRQASSRWSICAALDRHIERITGVPGDILPPLRYPNDKPPTGPEPNGPVNQAVYFGALNSLSITLMMNDVARELARSEGALHAYGGVSPNVAASVAWKERQFVHHGAFGDRNEFLEHCRRSYGFLYLPFSFEDESFRFSFPSKLVDYTTVGLPILVQAPALSPVGVWCSEHPDAALFSGERGPGAMAKPIEDLLGSADLRYRLAESALTTGERHFGFEPNWRRFVDAISGGVWPREAES